jgi:hypothetical protein
MTNEEVAFRGEMRGDAMQLLTDSFQVAAWFPLTFVLLLFLIGIFSFPEWVPPFFYFGTAIAAAKDTSHREGQSQCE